MTSINKHYSSLILIFMLFCGTANAETIRYVTDDLTQRHRGQDPGTER